MKEMAEQEGQLEKKTFPMVLRQGLESKRDDIMAALPDKLDADRFIMVALTAATKNERLRECSMASIYLSLMESARAGLFPDNKEAAIIPYGGHAEFVPMVAGLIRLMLRSPGLTKVEARVVRDGDEFDYQYGLDPQLIHKPVGSSDREITHAYAVMWRQGAGPTFEVVTREEIEQVRAASKAPNSPAWRDWLGEMCRKVALKRLAKYADLSPEATRAIELDHFVTGNEPWGSEYVDPASEEYRSQVVKERTQDRMADLKAKLAGEEPQAHPPLEHEIGQVQPEDPDDDRLGSPDAVIDPGPSAEASTEPAPGETARPAKKARFGEPAGKLAKGDVTEFWKTVNEIGLERVCEDLHINAGDTKGNQDHLRKWIESEMRGIWADGTKYLLEAYPDLVGKEQADG
jgi:recombination protein RecT